MTPLTLTSTSTRFRSTFEKWLKTAEISSLERPGRALPLLSGAGGVCPEVREKVMEQQLHAASGATLRHDGGEMVSGTTFSITTLDPPGVGSSPLDESKELEKRV